MRKTRLLEILDRRETALAALLLLLGCALRLALLGQLPLGLNQDEASAGYEAWAILRYGMDRCGNANPVLLTAWGSGQNALMSYLAMPGVAIFGLNEFTTRLPNALSGCLTLFVFWRLARLTRGPRFGLTALLVLALNPWHIMLSRWGLESNLLPFFLLTGIWCLVLARERPWALVGAGAGFGLALYAYGTAFFFLPPFLLLTLLRLRHSLRLGPGLCALGLFGLLALPIAGAQLISAAGLHTVEVLGFTLPRLTEGRQAATSVFGGGGLALAAANLRDFGRLLWTQSDGLIWNALPIWQGGLLYFFGLPAALAGLVASILQRRDRTREAHLRDAVYCGLLCAALISGNINRLNMLWLPLVYFSAVGLHLLLSRLGDWAAIPVAGLLACCLIFSIHYVRAFGNGGNVNFFPGLGEAVLAAEALEEKPIYITSTVNQPYIFALFYAQVPPDRFADTVEYRDENAAFRQVERFTGYEFQDPEAARVGIYWGGQERGEVLGRYGVFALCGPETP